MIWDGFDKRKFPRINIHCEINIHSEEAVNPLSAVTENVGIGGVCVILDRPLGRFEMCRVRFEIDKNLPKIESEGRVVWMVPTRDPKEKKSRYDIGIEFTGIDPAMQAVLGRFLEEYVEQEQS